MCSVRKLIRAAQCARGGGGERQLGAGGGGSGGGRRDRTRGWTRGGETAKPQRAELALDNKEWKGAISAVTPLRPRETEVCVMCAYCFPAKIY
jgi:hypothetical protein